MKDTNTKWNPKLYNEKHAFVFHYGESLIKLLNPKENERILDLGCGSGQLTSKINELAKEKCLIDGKWFADYKRIRVVAIKQKDQS